MDSKFYRRVSVIVGAYKRREDLLGNFNNWYWQRYPNIEFVIAVDKSTDVSPLVHQLTDTHSLVILRLNNLQHYRRCWVKNRCWELATGEYFLFLDVDIRFLYAATLEAMVDKTRQGYAVVIDDRLYDGRDAGGQSGSFMCAAWAMQRINGFNENLDQAWGYEENDVFVRIQKAGGNVAYYNHHFLYHVPHPDSWRYANTLSSDPDIRGKQFQQQINIAKQDMALIHPFEANLEKRCQPTEQVDITVERWSVKGRYGYDDPRTKARSEGCD